MNITVRRMLWVFGVGNSALALMGAIAVSEANLSAVQAALVLNAGASTIAFITLGVGDLCRRSHTVSSWGDSDERPRTNEWVARSNSDA